jgi:N-acetyl-gamma-glutamyl-phosphate reductase
MIADCKSGVSGAGRKAEVGTLLAEASDNFKAYGVKGHRHLPETRQGLEAISGRPALTFVAASGADDPRHAFDAVCAILPEARDTDFQACYEEPLRTSPSST